MKSSELMKVVVSLIAVLIGLSAIFKLMPTNDIAIVFISFTFGILAIIWTARAIKNLSAGSSLRVYTINFLLCIIFIVLASVISFINQILKVDGVGSSQWKGLIFVQYFFITVSYIVFVYASYQISKISQEFGFKVEAKKIAKVVEEKKKTKKARKKKS